MTAVAVVFLIGTVDNIEDDVVAVEITDSNYETRHTQMPIELFPCEISEGDFFHFANVQSQQPLEPLLATSRLLTQGLLVLLTPIDLTRQ